MKNFLRRFVFFFSPIVILIILIIVTDPYKILYEYDDYSSKTFPINRDYVSTQYYLDNKEAYNYDSFIFGSSKSSAFLTTDWQLNFEKPINPYHFDASAESIYGIYRKVALIDSLNTQIKNALFVLDAGVLEQSKNRQYHLFIKHYLLSGQSKIDFYIIFFKSLGHKHFFKFYLDYLLQGLITKITNNIPRDIVYTPKYNDMLFKTYEDILVDGEEKYYQRFQHYFYNRVEKETIEKSVIKDKQQFFLKEIKRILDKHNTNYKLVIDPSYHQRKINSKDLVFLQQEFGKSNVFDFSGKNEFTSEVRNYYEKSHYRPKVGKAIMNIIYH